MAKQKIFISSLAVAICIILNAQNSLISKIYFAQQQVYNAFVYQKLVTFRTCISVDLI